MMIERKEESTAPRETMRQTYTFEEFCVLLGIGRSTAHKLMKEGKLPVQPIKVGLRWLFPKRQVDRLLGIEG